VAARRRWQSRTKGVIDDAQRAERDFRAVLWVGLPTLVGRRGALGEARPTALVKMPTLSVLLGVFEDEPNFVAPPGQLFSKKSIDIFCF
jgi:hypothetical protein